MSLATSLPESGVRCCWRMLAWLCTAGMMWASSNPPVSAQEHQQDLDRYDIPQGMRVEIEIISERGIGRARLMPSEGEWPEELVLHLRLKGLESFTLMSPEWSAQTSISSTDGSLRKTSWSSLSETEREREELEAQDPRSLEVETIKENSAPDRLPPGFRVRIPAALLADSPKSLEIRWIDFYR